MFAFADDLPSRFPVGTRYVIEGRGGGRGALRIHLRYLEFPTAGMSSCPSMSHIARTCSAGGAGGGPEPENNFARRNRPRRPRVKSTAPGGVPPAPNPSPIRRETLAHFGAGVFLFGPL